MCQQQVAFQLYWTCLPAHEWFVHLPQAYAVLCRSLGVLSDLSEHNQVNSLVLVLHHQHWVFEIVLI